MPCIAMMSGVCGSSCSSVNSSVKQNRPSLSSPGGATDGPDGFGMLGGRAGAEAAARSRGRIRGFVDSVELL